MSVLSLYIPVISNTTSETYIKKMFQKHNIGLVLRVDFVKNKEKNRREAFIHFDEWFLTNESKKLKDDIMDIKTKTRFVYSNSGQFWPLLVNTNAHKRVNNPKYEVIKKEQVNSSYKLSLTNFPKSKNESNNKKQKTYASVVIKK
jgi:hypothetical protein